MSRIFEEIDHQSTLLGVLSLRRRRLPATGDQEVYEVKLDDTFLMSSLFTVAEIALANLGLAEVRVPHPEVVVGGLGLGYTARAALDDPRVSSLLVVDALGEVIGWHRAGLVPLGAGLTSDPRCRFVHADFFALAADPTTGFDPDQPGRRFDAILLDIDHSPEHLIHARHGSFYTPAGLATLARHLRPDGVFALWSNDPPDPAFMDRLSTVFTDTRAEVIRFPNPLQDREATNTIYLGRRRP